MLEATEPNTNNNRPVNRSDNITSIQQERKASASLDSARTIHLERGEPIPSMTIKTEQSPLADFIKNKFPAYGYTVTSVLHAIAGITSINNFLFPEKFKKLFDQVTVACSKAVTSITYAFLALEAFQKNKTFDCIARLLDPLFVPWMKLEDIHLARGMSAGLTLIDFSQMRKVGDQAKTKSENFFANLKATVEMLEESFKSGLGAKRKIFVDPEHDQGHTMAVFGHTIMLGSMLGVLFGANKRNLMNKVGGVIRNLGGFLGDITMILHGDRAFRLSGIAYAANAIIDAVQRFLPKSIIDPINHFNMILNNIGTYYYGKISRRRNENQFNDSFQKNATTLTQAA